MSALTEAQARVLRRLPETGPLKDLKILAFGVLHGLVNAGLASQNICGDRVTFNNTPAGREALAAYEEKQNAS